MWRRGHFKLLDGSLNNHFRSNFFEMLYFVAKMIHSRVDNSTIMIILMVIITHYERTEIRFFFTYNFDTNLERLKYARLFINKKRV